VEIIHKIRRFIGIDRALAWAGGARGVGMLLGPVGSFIIVWTLSAEEQGTYYLFLSLVSLQAIFDLGASAAIAQMTPHLIHNHSNPAALPEDDFIHIAVQWMNRIAVGFALTIGPGGLIYLHYSGQKELNIALMWLATVAVTAISGAQEGRLKILYGAGQVNWTNKLRFFSLLLRYPLQWILLVLGASLFSFSASLLAVFLFQHYCMLKVFPQLWPSTSGEPTRRKELQKELIHLVGRASITYASGILVFNIQQPIIYKVIGPAASAKLGFTSMVGATLITLASLWGLTRFPDFARKVAHGNIIEAFSDFKRTLRQTVGVALAGFFAALAALWVLHYIPRFSDRLMTIPESLPLFSAFLIQTIFLMTTYWPRSFRIEPFAPVACLQMVATPLAVWLFTKQFGICGVGWGNLFSWILGAGGITWIVCRFLPSRQAALLDAVTMQHND
jgi:hypothetical protein